MGINRAEANKSYVNTGINSYDVTSTSDNAVLFQQKTKTVITHSVNRQHVIRQDSGKAGLMEFINNAGACGNIANIAGAGAPAKIGQPNCTANQEVAKPKKKKKKKRGLGKLFKKIGKGLKKFAGGVLNKVAGLATKALGPLGSFVQPLVDKGLSKLNS